MSTLATAEESRTKLVSDAEDPQENAKKLRGQADELREEARELRQEARELRQEARQMQKNGKEELADKRIAEADKRIAEADKRIAEAEKLISTQAWRGNREAIDELAEVVTREVGKLNEGLQPLRNAVFGIPARTCHSATTAAEVKQNSVQHHRCSGQCLILRSLFPESAAWDHYSWNSCVAHLYSKSKFDAAQALGFHVDDPQNTLILLLHFELELDKGRLMLIPEMKTAENEELKLRIHVHGSLREEEVWTVVFYDGEPDWKEPIQVLSRRNKWKNLQFGDLHDRIFTSGPVYMRALFEKAVGAWNRYKDHPDPRLCIDRFKSRCLTWETYWGKRFSGEVGNAPVEQEVQHTD